MAQPDLSAFGKANSFMDFEKAAIEEARQRFAQAQQMKQQQMQAEMLQKKFELEQQEFEENKRRAAEGLFTGNSIQAQIGNQMRELGYTPQQIVDALTMKGIPLQDGGYATYSPPNIVGQPGAKPAQQMGQRPDVGELAKEMGLTGGGAQVPIDIGSTPAPLSPDDVKSRLNPALNIMVEPSMKRSEQMKVKEGLNKQADSLTAAKSKITNTISMIDRAENQINRWSTGFGASTLAEIGGTPAKDLSSTLDTVKANLGFEELNQMRQISPTGGALGQVTERELQFLQSVVASLDQSQSAEQLKQNLAIAKKQMQGMYDRLEAAYKRDLAQFGPEAMSGVNMPSMASAPQDIQQEQANGVRVTSDAEYDALPSGSTFFGPDGVLRRKP